MISIIVPAHNEASLIGQGLRAMTEGAGPGELEVIVVCNGCSDATADIARSFGEPVRVVETDVASKSHALNLGDAEARGFPRIYVDADVVLPLDGLRRLARALEGGEALAASPEVETILLGGTSAAVRGFYKVWMSLPYVREGMIGTGSYALSREGRARFDAFPAVIADDGYIRLLFSRGERIKVTDAVSRVLAPKTVRDLIKVKTRSRLGVEELARKFPDLHITDRRRKNYGQALLKLLARPGLYPGLAVYVWVTARSMMRVRKQARDLQSYVWERDNSSRIGPSQSPGGDRVSNVE
jgi:glycosyltransferase involved in cell wall biosynthesis